MKPDTGKIGRVEDDAARHVGTLRHTGTTLPGAAVAPSRNDHHRNRAKSHM